MLKKVFFFFLLSTSTLNFAVPTPLNDSGYAGGFAEASAPPVSCTEGEDPDGTDWVITTTSGGTGTNK